MFNTAEILSREYTVDLCIVDESPISDDRIEALNRKFNDVFHFGYPSYRFYLNAASGLPSSKPLQVFYYHFRAVQSWIERNSDKYDLLYCNHVRTTEYVRDLETPKVVDLVDAISRNYAELRNGATGVWRLIYPIESRRLLKYERQIIREFDHSFIISEDDKEHIQTDSEQFPSLSVVPNGVKDELLARPKAPTGADETEEWIIFLGKMDYFPNEDAAVYFANEVFPKVRESHQNTKFLIVGTTPSKKIKTLASEPNVHVTGFVDDPGEYLERARVVVAPMRFGAGIQNKVLEAMALGKPVVTTPLGKEGLAAEDGTHLFVSDSVDDFSESVTQLIENPTLRATLGQNARTLIKSEYTWEQVTPKILPPIRNIIQ